MVNEERCLTDRFESDHSILRSGSVAWPKIVFIVNPKAGDGSTGSDWPDIKATAEDRLGEFKSVFTAGPGDAKKITETAIAEGAEQLVCVGGDGTLNEVVNGFMESDDAVRSAVRLGFIPDGTGCDIVKTLPIPEDIEQAIDVIAAGHIRVIDVGRLFFKEHRGSDVCRYFHNVTSFGLGGEVAQRVNRTSKMFGPFISFIWATLLSLFLYGKKKVSLKIDDHLESEHLIWNVAVANGQYHGGGMWIAPDAAIDDALFHVTIIGNLSLPEVFLNLPKLYNGQIGKVSKVKTLTAKKIEAVSDQKVLLDIDGEQPGLLPAVIDILPGALNMITAD